MKKLLLYTAGSASREVLLAVQQLNERQPTWEVLGFVDEDPRIIGTEVDGYPVFGLDHNERGKDVYGICCVMDPKVRKRIVEEQIEGKGLALASIIHPSVVIPKDFEAGPGTVIMPSVNISFDVKLGKGVFVLWNVLLGHNLRAADYVTVLSSANITGGCSIGDRAIIGAGATINVNVSIGKDCLIGLGTTVFRNVGDNKSVVALPRQLVRSR